MLKPVGNRILIKGFKNPMISPGGIHLPPRLEGKSCKGEVINISDGAKLPIEIGDIVIFNAMGSVEVKHDGETFLILKEDLIYAKEDKVNE